MALPGCFVARPRLIYRRRHPAVLLSLSHQTLTSMVTQLKRDTLAQLTGLNVLRLGTLCNHHAQNRDPTVPCSPPQDRELISHITFMGRLWIWRQRDVVELSKAEPLAVHRHAKVAQINGLSGGLGDLVVVGSGGFALRRQIRHDDSADAKPTPTRGKKRCFCSKNKSQQRTGQGQEEMREDDESIKARSRKRPKTRKASSSSQQVSERVLLSFPPL